MTSERATHTQLSPVLPLAGRKVAHLTTVDLSLEFLLLAQLEAGLRAGAEVVGISATGPSAARLEAQGIRHITLTGSTRGMDLLGDVRACIGLWHILRQERPDILHTHNPKPGIYGRIIGRFARVPVIVNTVHGLYATPDDPPLKRAVVYALEAIASRFSHAELVQNEEDDALIRRLRLAPQGNVTHLGNGIDLQRFHPGAVSPERRSVLRTELGVRDDQVLVGTVGRFVREKGFGELIEAAESVNDAAAWLAVGGLDPDKADSLDAAMIRRGERAGIRFLDFCEDVRDLYGAMDIVALPSYREGVPRTLMEGAAMAKPLIATDVRGCRQVVDDGVNGRLVPPRDAQALRLAIEELVSCSDLRNTFGRASRRIAEERFDVGVVVEQVLATYERLLTRG